MRKTIALILLALLLRCGIVRFILALLLGLIVFTVAGCAGMSAPPCPKVKIEVNFCSAYAPYDA